MTLLRLTCWSGRALSSSCWRIRTASRRAILARLFGYALIAFSQRSTSTVMQHRNRRTGRFTYSPMLKAGQQVSQPTKIGETRELPSAASH